MENGVEIIDGSHVGEKRSLKDGVSEKRVEERVVVGSNELKDLEEEDVFEEAIGAQELLLELRLESDSGADVIGEENVETNGDPGFGEVGQNPSGGNGVEESEGTSEAPSEVKKNEESEQYLEVEKEEEKLVGGGSADDITPAIGIDEGGTGKGEELVELNKLSDNVLENGREDSGKEVSEVASSREVEVLKGEDELDVNSGLVTNTSQYDDSDNVNSELLPVAHVDEKVENGSAEVGDGNFYSHPEAKSDKEVLNGSGDDNEMNKSNLGVNDDGDETREQINACGSHHVEHHDDERADQSDNVAKVDTECQNDESSEMKDAINSIGSRNEEDSSEDLRHTSTYLNTEDLDGAIEEVDVSTVMDSEHFEETRGMKDTPPCVHTHVSERDVEMENGIRHSPEEIEKGKTKKLQRETEKLQGETKKFTDLISEDYKNSQHQHSDDKVVNGTGTGTEESKRGEKKEQEGKQNTQVNRGSDIQSVFASSSGKSTDPVPPPARPAGLGRAAPLLEPANRAAQQPRANGSTSHMQTHQIEDPANGEAEENDETREKLQMIRVKFLRLAYRLGQTPHNVVVAQVLYRLGLAEQLRGRNGGRVGSFSFDRASAMAEQLEAAGQEPLDFSCTIMVLGKTGVGKSATINSIFDEVKFGTDAFQMGTKKVQDIVGTVQGIKVRVIDTPGLLPSWSDQRQNEKILLSVKRFIKKTPPDIVLYLDRLDMQSRDFSDMPLLRTITEIFGPSIWFNAIVVLTHAASAPPDGPNGTASGYDMFVTQRSHVVQQAIRQAAGDMRLMNPVSLVENHSACRTNRAGQRVLPNGQVWKPHLLLLSFASKILAEANALLKLQDNPPGRPFATRSRAPPLPFLLSSLLQSRPQVKLPEDQFGDEDGVEDDLDSSSGSEDESEYDELPPFKRLTKAQVAKLSKAQKKAYFDELEYREKLFMQKQLKEEKKRRKMMKKMEAEAKDLPGDYSENVEEESGGAASVPVPMPDLALPASFDSDNPTHRYRYLDSSNQWLIRPVLETHGWDHDVGYEGINVEKLFVIKDKVPLSFSGQVTKDKKDANVQMEMASSVKHGEGKATSLGFDMQTVGKDLAYTLRSETIFSNFRKNKATAGLSVTYLGDSLSAGVKVEDKLIANKRFRVVVTGGATTARGDVAYGGSLEAQLRDKDYPLGRSLSTLGLSVMDWHGDLAIGCNIQSQIPVGRSTNLVARANLNNRGAGQVSIRLNSSEQLQIALVAVIPVVRKLLGFPQQLQFGQ